MGSPFPGPQSLYQNPPIEPQFYAPSQFIISAIALGTTTLVTTTIDHNYVVTQQCRLVIPNGYGCTQLNELSGYVIAVPALNQVLLDINSQHANSFIAASLRQQPQIMAIGDVNTGPINANGPQNVQTFISGSFINISPN